MYRQIILTVLGITLFFFGCSTDEYQTVIETTPPTPIDFYETTIEGFVVDEDNRAIEDVTISLGSESTTTNGLGYFQLSGVGHSQYTMISAVKEEYFNNYKTYIPSRDLTAHSQTRIQLMRRVAESNFESATGGIVTIEGQTQVTFQANSIVNSANEIYNGPVIVYSHYIDPTHDKIDQVMPGNLMARDAEGEMSVLLSFGMINVELQSPSGEKLDINRPATIEINIPDELKSKAPPQIPLWHFDEVGGLWKEEGMVENQGDIYVGQVDHFTFWNSGVDFDVAFIEGTVADSLGVPAIKVFLEDRTTGLIYTLWTDSEGNFFGAVPVDIEYTLFIEGLCELGGDIYSSTVGPFDDGWTDLGVIDISNNNGFTTVSGILVDCDQIPIEGGEVYFDYPEFNYTIQTKTDGAGNFRAVIPSCEDEDIEVRGINPSTRLVSDIRTVNVTGSFENVGTIPVCIDISPSLGNILITYNGGVEKSYDNATVTISEFNGATNYILTYNEVLPPANDTIAFYIIFSDSNSNLANPNWIFEFVGYSPPESAADEEYEYLVPNFNLVPPTVNVVQAASNPGEILKLNIDNFRITYRIKNVADSFQNYTGSSMAVEAVVLQ